MENFRSFMQNQFPEIKNPKGKTYGMIVLDHNVEIVYHIQKSSIGVYMHSPGKMPGKEMMALMNEAGIENHSINGVQLKAEFGVRNPEVVRVRVDINYNGRSLDDESLRAEVSDTYKQLKAIIQSIFNGEYDELHAEDMAMNAIVADMTEEEIQKEFIDGIIEDIEDSSIESDSFNEESDSNKGFPALLVKRFEDKSLNTEASKYLQKWQIKTETYSWRAGIKALIPEFFQKFDQICPVFTQEQIDLIKNNIEKKKIIPTLTYAIKNIPEFLTEVKNIWWLCPFVIWKEEIASYLFIDKNGFYAAYPNENEITLILPWDKVDHMYLDHVEDNLNTLYVFMDEDEEQYLTFSEFFNEEKNKGSYLSIIETIYEVYQPVIEASKGQSTWMHGTGNETFIAFDSKDELLDESKWKANPKLLQKMYGTATTVDYKNLVIDKGVWNYRPELIKLYSAGKFEDAYHLSLKLNEHSPDGNAEWFVCIGRFLFENGDLEGALQNAKHSEKLTKSYGDNELKKELKELLNDIESIQQTNQRNWTLEKALCYIYLCLAYSDGENSKEEVHQIIANLAHLTNANSEEEVQSMIALYNEVNAWYKEDAGDEKIEVVKSLGGMINKNLDDNAKKVILNQMMEIAKADGKVTKGEEQLIGFIQSMFGENSNQENSKNNSLQNYEDYLPNQFNSLYQFAKVTDKLPLLPFDDDISKITFDSEAKYSFAESILNMETNPLSRGIIYYSSNMWVNEAFDSPICFGLQGMIIRNPQQWSVNSPDYIHIPYIDFKEISIIKCIKNDSPGILFEGNETIMISFKNCDNNTTKDIVVLHSYIEELFNLLNTNQSSFEFPIHRISILKNKSTKNSNKLSYKNAWNRFQEINNETGIVTNEIIRQPNDSERDELWEITRVFLKRIYQLDEDKDRDTQEYDTLCHYCIAALHWNDDPNDPNNQSKGRFRRDTIALALCLYTRISRNYDSLRLIQEDFLVPNFSESLFIGISTIIEGDKTDRFFNQITTAEAQQIIEEYTKCTLQKGYYELSLGGPAEKLFGLIFDNFNSYSKSLLLMLTYITPGKGNLPKYYEVHLIEEDYQSNVKYLMNRLKK